MRWQNNISAILLWLISASVMEAAHVVNNAGRLIEGTTIAATADGAVTLTTASGQILTFRKGQYRSAAAERPEELSRAEHLLRSGQGRLAVPLLKQVKESCRFLAHDQTAILLLANHYFETGRFAGAVKEYQALEDQQDPAVRKKLREAMMKSGDHETILTVLQADIAGGSREAAAQAYLLRGQLRADSGDIEGARRDWLKIVTFFSAQKDISKQAEELL